MLRVRFFAFALTLALAVNGEVHGADLLDQVPQDALGLVVVRNLAESDSKAGKILSATGSRLPGPLALLKSIAGIEAGLDERRDLMVVLLPSPRDADRFSLALWLPVSDYEALVHALDGDPGRRIAAVTLAGEDLLVVRDQKWAVVMDPDQRDRLEQLREPRPAPPQQVAGWSTWIATNDATVLALPPGMKLLLALAEREKLFEPLPQPVAPAPGQDLFGPANRPAPPPSGWPAARDWVRSVIADRPELARWAAQAEGAALGVRLDQHGNAVLGLQLALAEASLPNTTHEEATAAGDVPPTLYASGEFVLTGTGQVSPPWIVPAVAIYVRQVANDLTNNYLIPVDEKNVAKFRAALEQAIAEVYSFSVLTRPGSADEAVFTNNFLAVRVDDAQEFLVVVAKCVRLWNEMLSSPQAGMKLLFDSKDISVAGHDGTEYSIDMAAAVNAPAIPEARASMEKLFGPGALFRLQMIAVDERTVLLAAATEEQVDGVLRTLESANGTASGPVELEAAATLLPRDSAWQLYVSPYGYTTWLRRQMDAVLGPVIGGPIVHAFPATPPVGLAGGVDGRKIWLEVAAPIDTIRGLRHYVEQ